MILVIGGAYQGKLTFVQQRFGNQLQIFFCEENCTTLDFSADVISGFHLFVLACVKNGLDSKAYIQENRAKLLGKIIICDDISCGVVPVDETLRLWREALGHSLAIVSNSADEVYRVFCGIATQLK